MCTLCTHCQWPGMKFTCSFSAGHRANLCTLQTAHCWWQACDLWFSKHQWSQHAGKEGLWDSRRHRGWCAPCNWSYRNMPRMSLFLVWGHTDRVVLSSLNQFATVQICCQSYIKQQTLFLSHFSVSLLLFSTSVVQLLLVPASCLPVRTCQLPKDLSLVLGADLSVECIHTWHMHEIQNIEWECLKTGTCKGGSNIRLKELCS